MAPFRIIVVAQGVDCAHAKDDVVEVAMESGANILSEVEGDGGENAVRERADERRESESKYGRFDCTQHIVEEGECLGTRKGVRRLEKGQPGKNKKKTYALLPWWAILRMYGLVVRASTMLLLLSELSIGIGC